KVKIDDGTFFGGEDLVEWLCSRLRQEVAFGAAVCKELEEERLASGIEFDSLSENEKELKKSVQEKAVELEKVERRLADTTEALQSQKQLRVKEMLQNQGAAKEMNGLRSELSELMERINLQADVAAAVEKECAALRSTVQAGRHAREVEDENYQKTLKETLKREEGMMRLKRLLHKAETDKTDMDVRMTRLQREMDRLRATLWSHGISPVSVAAPVSKSNSNVNPASSATCTGRVAPQGAHRGRQNGLGRRRDDTHHQHKHRQNKKLVPISGHLGSSGSSGSSSVNGSSVSFGETRDWKNNS
ncbi:unnamed protein product, partial [Pylaiella littoralis]